MKNGWLSVVKLDSNTRVPSTNTSQHESTRINMSPARARHESTRARHEPDTSQHEQDTSQHELKRVRHESTRINTSQHESV